MNENSRSDMPERNLQSLSRRSTIDLEKNQGTIPATEADTKRAYLVKWDPDDPENPKNWNPWYRAWLCFQMALLAFVGSFGSSIISPSQPFLATHLDVSLETSVLVVSLFVLGYAFGPMVFAPLGEAFGRKISMLPALFVLGIFSIGTAVSHNAASLFITRFFGGLFASAPVSNVSAAVGDLYDAKERGIPMALIALCVVGGPCVAPIVGAAITINPHMGWRWTEYIQAIFTFSVVALCSFALPETYHPVLLQRKAQRLRTETGNPSYWHPHETEKVDRNTIFTKYIFRPGRMLFTESMVTCIAAYASFVYGLLFFQLESFPIVFGLKRGYSTIVSTLPFLGLFAGVVFALIINIANQKFYAKALARNNGRAVPEARLPPMLVGGVFFSAGLFWFGWTADPKYSWALPSVAAGFIGAGFNITFQQCLNYLADTYGPLAASAMAANTFLRSLLAFGLPLAARPLFLNLGVAPGSSLLGGISCVALPVPLLLMKYGRQLREKSKYTPKPD
ncbi:hypothetical protein H2204_005960 [Knufia peltigerae]|uniref:Major facilitator superfamily (MFS) profile domain-containing protein n=1 Tax=Knufia peltigerae TaxID=1002370 RepID=A0AA38Y5Z2_9EURO|nr:hypothetical protein H2204_005960 [Knufia peltigerae]